MHVYDCNFKRFEIQQWLIDRQVQCDHEEVNADGVLVRTNLLSVMVDRCKRFSERLRTIADNDTVVKNDYQGKLLSMPRCEKYCFTETQSRMGHVNFEFNTPYIVPGWSADRNEDLPAGGFVILVSTMNLALNHACAQCWYAGNVTLAVDHTFNVLPSSLCFTSCHHCVLHSILLTSLFSCRWTVTVTRIFASTSSYQTKVRTGSNVMGHTRHCVLLLGCTAQVFQLMGHTQQCFGLLVYTVHLLVLWTTNNIINY